MASSVLMRVHAVVPAGALALSLAIAGCAALDPQRAPRPRAVPRTAPPVKTARARPPAPPKVAPPPHVALHADDGPLTAKISSTTSPNRAAALRLTEQARALLAAGEDARAVEVLERAIAVDARVPYAYYFLAAAHARADRLALARSFVARAEQMLAREPYWLGEARTLRGQICEREGRTEDARTAYAQALRVAPTNPVAGEALARLGGTPPEEP